MSRKHEDLATQRHLRRVDTHVWGQDFKLEVWRDPDRPDRVALVLVDGLASMQARRTVLVTGRTTSLRGLESEGFVREKGCPEPCPLTKTVDGVDVCGRGAHKYVWDPKGDVQG